MFYRHQLRPQVSGEGENHPFYRGRINAKADLLLCAAQEIIKRNLGILSLCCTSTLSGHLLCKSTVDVKAVLSEAIPP